jgi:lysophospholipase L1-like esterase
MALKGFAFAVMLASVLTGVVVGLFDPATALRLAAVMLAVSTIGVGAMFVGGRRPAWGPIVMTLGAAVLGLLAWHVSHASSPVPMRSLYLAAVLAWGAVLLAAALRLLRITDESKGLLLGFSIAIPLLIADALVPAPVPPQQTKWQVNSLSDPQIGFRYAPHSIAKNFYPTNPRDYFERTDPITETWHLETHGSSQATLEHAQTEDGRVMRITIPKLAGAEAWHVKLQQKPFTITGGTQYVVSFHARAAAPRQVGCAVGNNHEPWLALGTYHEYTVGTEWNRFECPFVATASDSNARLFFDLAKSDTPVELANVVVRDVSANRDVQPVTSAEEFFISYRFNSLGFRGPERAIPAPPGTFRILALGDSYALGVGVREEDTFEAQLEGRLKVRAAAAGDARVYEVINAGVSGYDTRQERLSYERYSSKYEPQVVLVMMVFNDDMSFEQEQANGLVDTNPRGVGISRLAARVTAMTGPQRLYDYTRSIDELLELNAITKKRGQKMAVVFFRHSDVFAPWNKLVADVTAGLEGTDVPLLDLGKTLLGGKFDENDLKVHEVDGHPNEIAHRLAAEEIDRFLQTAGLLPK